MFNKFFMLTLISGIFISASIAQQRISINGIDVIQKSGLGSIFNTSQGQVYNGVPAHCLDFLSNNKKFTVIDRQNLTLLNAEKELQKSEDFIDGYMISQGKSEGVDFILKSMYYADKKELNIKIYDVAAGNIKCSQSSILDTKFLTGVKDLQNQVRSLMHDLMWNCFNTKFSVVRNLDPSGKKTKDLLVAMGTKSRVEVEDDVEIFELVELEVDGEKLQRKEVIGIGRITTIQDANFSEVKIKSGNEVIGKALVENKKLYCTIINSYK